MAGKNQAPVLSELVAIATAKPTHQAAKLERQKEVRAKLPFLATSHPRTKLCLERATQKFCLLLFGAALLAIETPVFTWNLSASV